MCKLVPTEILMTHSRSRSFRVGLISVYMCTYLYLGGNRLAF